MSARSGRIGAASGQFDMAAAVVRLMALAANKRAARERAAADADQPIGLVFVSFLNGIPEPSPERREADRALKAFADELAAIGGRELMVEVYEETADRHGYRALSGVSASWDGRYGWVH